MRRLILPLCAAVLVALVATVQAPADPPAVPRPAAAAPADAREQQFEQQVRPLLIRRCVNCHGPNQQGGGLRLDSRTAALKGGGRGASIDLAQPEESLLLRVVTGRVAGLKMPPDGPLDRRQLEGLRGWLTAGAVWPEGRVASTLGPLWSTQPLRDPRPPRVRDAAWVRNPIDAFVLARLEAAGMRPAPDASREALIRRATFDLTGLPPTFEETQAFLSDRRPDAYERLVDRLLASPRYGERWARYWLDLVRYADTNGYERDAARPFAWKYRDYVIRALNEDKPYDRFVSEQLAGDELPDRSEESVVATGFLRMGTWDDEPNDPLEYQYERLDDVVHATATAFLGLTVRCARCHDHKFDPIPQKDYYAIAAAFWPGYLRPGDGKLMGGPPESRLGFPVFGFTDEGPSAPELRLLVNGDPRRTGPVVGPGYLSLLPAVQRPAPPGPEAAVTTHRRLLLARWITDPKNPLPPRVLVNRLWQHHFGNGLVRTPNNFGRKGATPTHPELLDWLATTFLRDGMRLKPLHRRIMLSRTYRMASVHPLVAEYSRRDFANEKWWHFNRRRLDADALRDALLFASGELNPKMGGPGFVPSVSREALEGLSRKGAEWQVSSLEEQRRRTVYMFLKRALIPPLLTVFDFGDTTQPLEQRETSVVAPQALALMNNAFTNAQAAALAVRVVAGAASTDAARVDAVWRAALGRNPSVSERSRALAALSTWSREGTAAAAARAVEPEEIPGLRLRLRADSGLEIEAGRVARWRAMLGPDAHQPSPSARPTARPTSVRGQPAVHFDGAGRWLRLAGELLTGPDHTVVAVVNDEAAAAGVTGHREILSNWRREDNIGSALFLGLTGTNAVRFSDAFSPAGAVSEPAGHFVLSAQNGRSGAAVYQNRRLIAERAGPLPDRNHAGPWVIGQQGNIQGEFWRGDILELLVFDHALEGAELEQIWGYVHRRYALAPPAPPPNPAVRPLTALAHVLLNTNEFLFID